MINVTRLDVVSGAIGTLSDTSDLAAEKTIVASGVTGTVVILASGDGVLFLPVATIAEGSAIVTVAAKYMQVDASAGSASAVFVMAEQGLVRSAGGPDTTAGTVPEGAADAIDATAFGPTSTLYVINNGGAGSIDVELAGSDNTFVPFKSYPSSVCITEKFSAFAIRAVGSGATGFFAVSSERPAMRALNSPAPTFVFRPGGIRGGNVYTDWAALVSALGSVDGRRILEFDDSAASPCVVPAGTWDMRDVMWAGFGPSGTAARSVVEIREGAVLTNLRMFGGQIQVNNMAETIVPISDFGVKQNMVHIGLRDDNGTGEIRNLGQAPLFDLGAHSAFFFVQNCLLGVVSATPMIRHSAGSMCTINLLGQNQTGENLVSSGVGAIVMLGALSSAAQIGADQSSIGLGKLVFGPLGRIQRSVLPLPPTPGATTTPQFNKPMVLLRCDGRNAGFAVQLPNIRTQFFVGNTTVPLYTGGQEVVVAEVEGGAGLTIHATGGDTIDGLPFDVHVPRRGSRTLISDGLNNWITLSAFEGHQVWHGPNEDAEAPRHPLE